MLSSVGMPAYYEMMISHSPPVFSHSPPAGFLTDLPINYSRLYDHPPRSCRPQVLHSPLSSRKSFPPLLMHEKSKPLTPKSCLITRPEPNSPTDTEENSLSSDYSRTKKKLIFADDKGLPLTHVRVMSEPSNVPPLWSLKFLAQVTQGLVSPHPSEQWTVDFRQPASDYLDFRRKIDEKNVSLENVIVKENESIIVGTVKVKNICFNKEVIVRATWDNWKSHEDIFCVFSQIYGPSTAYVIYDTFSFKITLPPSSNSRKLEFCVCFRIEDGTEYWDNNNGKNYTLTKRSPSGYQRHNAEILLPYNKNNIYSPLQNCGGYRDPIPIPQIKVECRSQVPTWMEFSSWNNNDHPSPYWRNLERN